MTAAFDVDVFHTLVKELESSSTAVAFLTSFASMLDDRIHRIERALTSQNREELRTALFSLRASAAMAGATQMQTSATTALADQPHRNHTEQPPPTKAPGTSRPLPPSNRESAHHRPHARRSATRQQAGMRATGLFQLMGLHA
ncbi:MAG: hypothetical protein JWM61_1144 [Micrococcaceae bacterium]|jgi:HPt (histidine-containing phosphotransfer) domain-containing protein|nr:hypothetical protein [Micrococcaceae bacterium]